MSDVTKDPFKQLVQTLTEPPKILLLEDDDHTTELMKRAVSGLECVLIAESDPEAAIKLLRSNKFELALLDVRLGKGSGLEMFRWMVRDGIDVPVCFWSAYLTNDTIASATRIGDCVFMNKPELFTQDKLRRIFRIFRIRAITKSTT